MQLLSTCFSIGVKLLETSLIGSIDFVERQDIGRKEIIKSINAYNSINMTAEEMRIILFPNSYSVLFRLGIAIYTLSLNFTSAYNSFFETLIVCLFLFRTHNF